MHKEKSKVTTLKVLIFSNSEIDIICYSVSSKVYKVTQIEDDLFVFFMGPFILLNFLETIDELTEMVVPLVANVENKNVTVPEWKDHPVGAQQMKVSLQVVKYC